jgi:hypothetical protein
MTLSDFRNELKVLGFDGFQDAELDQYVNRGYFHIARKNKWYWEQTVDTFTVAPGTFAVNLWPIQFGELPSFRSLDKLYGVTANFRNRMRPLSDDEFFTNWLPQDLSKSNNRGEPSAYYVWNSQLYLLPPPASSRDFVAHYHRRVAPMTDPGDAPITPVHLDEAVLRAAKIRAHERAQEWDQASAERTMLEEFLDDMRDDEESLMDEQPTRTTPDNSWL